MAVKKSKKQNYVGAPMGNKNAKGGGHGKSAGAAGGATVGAAYGATKSGIATTDSQIKRVAVGTKTSKYGAAFGKGFLAAGAVRDTTTIAIKGRSVINADTMKLSGKVRDGKNIHAASGSFTAKGIAGGKVSAKGFMVGAKTAKGARMMHATAGGIIGTIAGTAAGAMYNQRKKRAAKKK